MSASRGISKLEIGLRTPPNSRRTDADVPRGFVEFCRWGGVELTPGQAELCRVSYDGARPVDGELAARIFGTLPDLPMVPRPIAVSVCGARGGKSYVLVALRLVHGMLVRDLSPLRPGQLAGALVIAPRDDHRMEVYRYARGFVLNKPELASMLDAPPKVDEFTLRRSDGKRVVFKTGVATSGGTAARGAWWTDVALDECAFFRDGSYKINDEEIFKAATARVLPGGQVILTSTPWAEAGLLYDFWKKKPESAIVAHAPTLVLNPEAREVVEREEARDPDNAKREFGAVFMTSGTTVFFEAACIDAALTDEPFEMQPGDQISAGGDFGFRSDSSALILVAKRGDELHVFDGREERPEDGAPLKPSKTVASFAECIGGRCSYLMADQHYREAIAEHLETHDLTFAPAPLTPADTYVRARMLLRECRVVIHPLPFRDRMVQQMREVQGRPTSGGGMSIVHPKWSKGGHGDLCAALVLAVWQASGDEVPAPPPATYSREWEEKRAEERKRRLVEGQDKATHWRRLGARWRAGA